MKALPELLFDLGLRGFGVQVLSGSLVRRFKFAGLEGWSLRLRLVQTWVCFCHAFSKEACYLQR